MPDTRIASARCTRRNKVFKVPDLTRDEYRTADGPNILNFPLVGDLKAAGKTVRENLNGILTKKLDAKYLRSPQVTIFVKENNSQRVTIEGSVKTSRRLPTLKGRTSLHASAGDFRRGQLRYRSRATSSYSE